MDMIDKWCVKKREIKKKKNIGLIYFFWWRKMGQTPKQTTHKSETPGEKHPITLYKYWTNIENKWVFKYYHYCYLCLHMYI